MAQQNNWRFCRNCYVMFYDGFANYAGLATKEGRCAAGGAHQPWGFDFFLPHDVPATPTTQPAWRFCGQCYGLFFDGFAENGRCPAGGGEHTAWGFNFVLPHDMPGTAEAQPAWRFCGRCYAMFYDGFAKKGRCVATGGDHIAWGFNFVLPHDLPDVAAMLRKLSGLISPANSGTLTPTDNSSGYWSLDYAKNEPVDPRQASPTDFARVESTDNIKKLTNILHGQAAEDTDPSLKMRLINLVVNVIADPIAKKSGKSIEAIKKALSIDEITVSYQPAEKAGDEKIFGVTVKFKADFDMALVRLFGPFEQKAPDRINLRVEPATLEVPQGGKATLTVRADRKGFPGWIRCRVNYLPPKVSADHGAIYSDFNSGTMTLYADADAPVGTRNLIVEAFDASKPEYDQTLLGTARFVVDVKPAQGGAPRTWGGSS